MPDNYVRVFRRRQEPDPEAPCEHLADVAGLPEPATHQCDECVASGSHWLHLRMCIECGYVGCCDSSPNTHTTKHHEASGHQLIRGIEPGEHWAYCYTDRETMRVPEPND